MSIAAHRRRNGRNVSLDCAGQLHLLLRWSTSRQPLLYRGIQQAMTVMQNRAPSLRCVRAAAHAATTAFLLIGCSSGSGGDSSTSRGAAHGPSNAGSGTGTAGSSDGFGPGDINGPGDVKMPTVIATPNMTTGASSTTTTPMSDMLDRNTCGASNKTGLTDTQIKALMTGGDKGSMRWLYPYDQTVFPRGMLAPTLMWDGADGKAVYIHIQSSKFDYQGCLATTGPQQLQLDQELWHQAGLHSGGAADPFTIDLTVQGASGPNGPIREQIIIAQATIKGSLYYNSYSGVGAIYRIPPGGSSQPFLSGTGCYGCHTVSANGQRLLTSTGGDPGASYELTPMTQSNPPMLALAPTAAFGGVSPDGSVYVASAHPAGAVRPQGTPTDELVVNDAALYLTDTGAAIAGSDIPTGAMMPIFSPGGTLLAFNDFAEDSGRGLVVMDFDPMAHHASNRRVVFKDSGDTYPGWPFFLPDDKALVFARGVNSEFSGAGAGVLPGLPIAGPASDLYIVDLASGTATMLAKAMGLSSPQDTTGYTPFGAEDLHQHYYPTVSPVAAGGYFWVFFDSIRHYGNQGIARQLWGTAIQIAADGTYNSDPSHPAFYVAGQDFNTGNHRAFTALDPCKKDGDSCTSGIDCCGGTCYFDGPAELVEPMGTCSPKKKMMECSRQDEHCSAASDCCSDDPKEASLVCIAGFCAVVRGPS